MGWLYTPGQSRKRLIERLIRPYENDLHRQETIAHCTVGNVLWSVRKITNKKENTEQSYIGCDLLQNGGTDGWGYKDLSESAGPCYYSCPLSYLSMCEERNPEWRECVKRWHANKAAARAKTKQAKIGQVWALKGCSIPNVRIVGKRKRTFLGSYEGHTYRLPTRVWTHRRRTI